MGGEVREISLKRAFRGAILRTRAGVDEHVLLLGEASEDSPGAVADRRGSAVAAGIGDARGGQRVERGGGAFLLECRRGGVGAG